MNSFRIRPTDGRISAAWHWKRQRRKLTKRRILFLITMCKKKKGQKVLSLVVTIDPVDDAAAQANLDSINSTVRKKEQKEGPPHRGD